LAGLFIYIVLSCANLYNVAMLLKNKLRILRAKAGFRTQQALADAAKVTLGIVVSIECGRTTRPHPATQLKLATALNVEVGELDWEL